MIGSLESTEDYFEQPDDLDDPDTSSLDLACEDAFILALAQHCNATFEEVSDAFFALPAIFRDLAWVPDGWPELTRIMCAPGTLPLRASVH